MIKPKLKDAAQGKWKSILPALGIDAKYLVNRGGPCPLCKDGHDRFRFDDKDGHGTWFCNRCGSGTGIDLVMKCLGISEFKEVALIVEKLLPSAVTDLRRSTDPDGDKKAREAMNSVWTSGRKIDLESVAGRYLFDRTGFDAFRADLRSVAMLAHYAEGERIPTKHPALIALIRDHAGTAINIHRTWLNAKGGKANVKPPRKVMKGKLTPGFAIRLSAHDDVLGIAEGIETALSAAALFSVPVWSAISTTGMEQWRPPAGVKVIVFADNDLNFAGQKAANNLAFRLTSEGVQVAIQTPERPGDDWNDVYLREHPTGSGPNLQQVAA